MAEAEIETTVIISATRLTADLDQDPGSSENLYEKMFNFKCVVAFQ